MPSGGGASISRFGLYPRLCRLSAVLPEDAADHGPQAVVVPPWRADAAVLPGIVGGAADVQTLAQQGHWKRFLFKLLDGKLLDGCIDLDHVRWLKMAKAFLRRRAPARRGEGPPPIGVRDFPGAPAPPLLTAVDKACMLVGSDGWDRPGLPHFRMRRGTSRKMPCATGLKCDKTCSVAS